VRGIVNPDKLHHLGDVSDMARLRRYAPDHQTRDIDDIRG
jgi:hypothetical protein